MRLGAQLPVIGMIGDARAEGAVARLQADDAEVHPRALGGRDGERELQPRARLHAAPQLAAVQVAGAVAGRGLRAAHHERRSPPAARPAWRGTTATPPWAPAPRNSRSPGRWRSTSCRRWRSRPRAAPAPRTAPASGSPPGSAASDPCGSCARAPPQRRPRRRPPSTSASAAADVRRRTGVVTVRPRLASCWSRRAPSPAAPRPLCTKAAAGNKCGATAARRTGLNAAGAPHAARAPGVRRRRISAGSARSRAVRRRRCSSALPAAAAACSRPSPRG